MFLIVRAVAVGTVLTLLASAAAGQGAMQHVALGDPATGTQEAMGLNIPQGWRFRGEITRNVTCSPGDPFPEMEAFSPDGTYGITMMYPFFTFPVNAGVQNLQSCGAIAQVTRTGEILKQYVLPQLRRGAQQSAAEPVPNAQPFLEKVRRSNGQAQATGDTARVKVSFTQNGQAVEEYFVGFTMFVRVPGLPAPVSTTMVGIYRAPAGKLDEFYARAERTMVVAANPQWEKTNAMYAQQMQQQLMQQASRGGAGNAGGNDGGAAGRAMLAQTQKNIAATGTASMNAAAASEAARHASAVGTMNYVGDRPTTYYAFCSGGRRVLNNNPNPPGNGWVACQ